MSSNESNGMSLIVKVITRLTVGLILLYGIASLFHGHLSPGGGFDGGVIIALALIHFVLAFGKEEAFRRLSKPVISCMVSIGGLLFISIASIGFTRGAFFYNWLPQGKPFALLSAGTIPLSNIAIGLTVGFGLFAIFIVLITYKFEAREK